MLEIKIVFKSGYIGYFTAEAEEKNVVDEAKRELKSYISNRIKNNATGTIELIEKETGFETNINLKEIATFGVKTTESEVK